MCIHRINFNNPLSTLKFNLLFSLSLLLFLKAINVIRRMYCEWLGVCHGWMFQVTCIHGKTPAQVHPDPVAVRPRLQIILGIPRTVIMLTPLTLSVRIREEKATKVGMPPALLNPASKALISKSGPPHDHFNWLVVERCAEYGLALLVGYFFTFMISANCTSESALQYETFFVVFASLIACVRKSFRGKKNNPSFEKFCATYFCRNRNLELRLVVIVRWK